LKSSWQKVNKVRTFVRQIVSSPHINWGETFGLGSDLTEEKDKFALARALIFELHERDNRGLTSLDAFASFVPELALLLPRMDALWIGMVSAL
jgi:hypothetical protein